MTTHVCKLMALYTANAYSAEREIPASACILALWLVSNVCGCTSVSRLSLVFRLLFLLNYCEHLVKYALALIVSW